MVLLLVLHAGAAIKHALVNKDGVMESMRPATLRQWSGIAAILCVLGGCSAAFLVTLRLERATSALHDVAAAPGADFANWTVDPAASRLFFVGQEKGKRFEGEFRDFSVQIAFDPTNLESSHIDATVATASARTASELRDSLLPGVEWFDVKNHPYANFRSTGIRLADGGAYEIDGTLKIKNYEVPIRFISKIAIAGDKAHATGGLELIRTDFGLGRNSSWLNDEGIAVTVEVGFEIFAHRSQ